MNPRRHLLVALATLGLSACCHVPASVKLYASELPARADGQYATLDDLIKKQLVMKDALLQCKIDLEDGKTEPESAACNCAESASADWLNDCKSWLGPHTPAAATTPPSPDPTPATS